MLNQLSPRKLFLIDSLGAVVTALLLSQVIARFESTFGMPANILYNLAAFACILAAYSFFNYLFMRQNWSLYLGIIATANATYCIVTLGLVFYQYSQLTALGIAYFTGEVLVIMTLVRFEFSAVQKHTNQ